MDLTKKHELAWLSRIVADLRHAVRDAEPLLVGAMARDLLLHYGAAVPVARATADTDLAFAVEDWNAFNELRNSLISAGAFSSTRAEHRLIHRGTRPIDLIPFDGVQDETGAIHWPDNGNRMGVLGFREAAATSIAVLLPNGQQIKTVSLPILAVLKLLAWTERRHRSPGKDASDFFLVARNFMNSHQLEALAADHPEMLEQDGFDYEIGGAWFLGRTACNQIVSCKSDTSLLINALTELLSDKVLDEQFASDADLDTERALTLFRAFAEGWQARPAL